MKKLTSIILAIILALSVSACAGDNTPQSSVSNPPPASPSDNSPTPSPSAPSESSNTSSAQNNKPNYSLTSAVIIDDENCSFTITSVEESGFWGFSLKVLCENKADIDLMFSWDNVSVNSYMADPFWATEVAAGKKSNTEISFSDSTLERCNIESIDEIVFTLIIYDSNDWLADRLISEEFVIYPTGLDANSIIYPTRKPTATEQIVIDNESCTFIIESENTDSLWGYTLICYLENKTPEPLMYSWDNVSVNGFMVDPYWATSVQPGKRCYSDISFSNSKFEENGISSVEEIEFKLRIYDSDSWSAPDVVNEVFSYSPS